MVICKENGFCKPGSNTDRDFLSFTYGSLSWERHVPISYSSSIVLNNRKNWVFWQ